MEILQRLPIDTLLPEIVQCIEVNTISIVRADPGAGKTTRLPLALLNRAGRKVFVLEPRRLAARLAARRIAEEMGSKLGEVVGHQVRWEKTGTNSTRLWYLTEGVLTNRLLSGDSLPHGSVVVLDEFHERHLETDLALALMRRLQRSRSDLRVVIMSATLDADDLSRKLGSAPVINVPGPSFPVDVLYSPASSAALEQQVAAGVARVAGLTQDHVLVFLPGSAEIRKAMRTCEPLARSLGARLLPLHGELSPDEQDTAVLDSDIRKVICSTNVAESSVTINRIGAVVDTGLARVLHHSPWTGFSRLQLEKVSRSSAIQRAGRAGRTGRGVALRLFSEADFVRRADNAPPEILRSELSQLLLQLSASGEPLNPDDWIDPPPAMHIEVARELLIRLRAFDAEGAITDDGRTMAALPVHPRLARLVLDGCRADAAHEACELAAKLGDSRFRVAGGERSQFSSDLDAILASEPSFEARRTRSQLLDVCRKAKSVMHGKDHDALERAVVAAYPDRLARRRGDILLLASGGSAQLDRDCATHGEFVVALDIDERSDRSVALVRLASQYKPEWILDLFPERVKAEETVAWNRESERVEQINSLKYDELTLDETRSQPTNTELASRTLIDKALEAGFRRFAAGDEVDRLLARVRFASEHSPQFPAEEVIVRAALEGLGRSLMSFAELLEATSNGGLLFALQRHLDLALLDELAPSHIVLPRGRRVRVEYEEGLPPSISSRLQDFFGSNQQFSVARGAVPVVIKLLAPNHRPVQVTTDLPSFWKNLYPQLRRELGRRYPKHAWPEDPR
ncbi:MAG: ATP-dependent helicase HrpB [Bryobacteraceae bacterium]